MTSMNRAGAIYTYYYYELFGSEASVGLGREAM